MATTSNIGFVRDELREMLPRWELIRDCLSGQPAIKKAGTNGDKYLPRPNATDTSPENLSRYLQYVERAVFYNVTQRTHSGLVGQVFQREPVIELPALLEAMGEDVDGGGVSLIQQAKKALGFVLAYGRCGMLADYPKTAAPSSRKDVLDGKLRPSVVLYDPWAVINWRTITVGARKLLSLVVINEEYIVDDDGFEMIEDNQWRVLSIEPDFIDGDPNPAAGRYRAAVWRQDLANGGVFSEVEASNPVDSSGSYLREIPFTFIGALNNDPNVDAPPMYDLASMNVAHYRNSADYEESCFLAGQPTPVFAGLTKDWVNTVMGGKVSVGARAGVMLPAGGTWGLMQATANSMPMEAMVAKERQMVALGAKLVEQQSVQRTLGEARLEYATEISVLGSCAKNVASAYQHILKWCGAYAGTDEESTIELNPEFELGRMDAQERAALLAEWQGKAITFTEMRTALKNAGVASQDDEEAKGEIESSVDFGLGVKGSGSTPPGTTPAAAAPAAETPPAAE